VLPSPFKLSRPSAAGGLVLVYGGGRRLGVVLVADVDSIAGMVTNSYGELEILDNDCLDEDLGTATQSGSSFGVNGFEGRLGFRTVPWPSLPFGRMRSARAG
jgi:hypothetical protein